MSWEGSDRKDRLPANWAQLRALALSLCGYRCTVISGHRRCGRRATEVDHFLAGDDHRIENLRGICTHHHRKKSSAEGHAAKAAIKSKRTRPPEAHPGDLS